MPCAFIRQLTASANTRPKIFYDALTNKMRDDEGIVWVERTARWSAVAQIVLGLVTLIGFIKVPTQDTQFLWLLLVLDISVQTVEFSFYAFFVCVRRLDTWYRYLDWYISTPIMLISTMALLEYMHNPQITVNEFASHHNTDIIYVVLINWIMLSFGLCAEFGWIPRKIAIMLGFLPFVAMFTALLARFSRGIAANVALLLFMCIAWSMYGVAALLSYAPKNIAYNCLDVVSKNFYGVVVAAILLSS